MDRVSMGTRTGLQLHSKLWWTVFWHLCATVALLWDQTRQACLCSSRASVSLEVPSSCCWFTRLSFLEPILVGSIHCTLGKPHLPFGRCPDPVIYSSQFGSCQSCSDSCACPLFLLATNRVRELKVPKTSHPSTAATVIRIFVSKYSFKSSKSECGTTRCVLIKIYQTNCLI